MVEFILDFLSKLDVNNLTYLFVGGIERSGTSFFDALLHSHPQILSLDECMDLKGGSLIDFLDQRRNLHQVETAIFRTEAGDSWRGYDESSDDARRAMLMICLMASTTNIKKFSKKASDIRVIACKTPRSEHSFIRIARFLQPYKSRYIHCVRDPSKVLCSNWEMPWITTCDPEAFLTEMAHSLDVSRRAYEKISASQFEAMFLDVSRLTQNNISIANENSLPNFIDIDESSEWTDFLLEGSLIDTWPKHKRRAILPLTDFFTSKFEAQAEVADWRKYFRMPKVSPSIKYTKCEDADMNITTDTSDDAYLGFGEAHYHKLRNVFDTQSYVFYTEIVPHIWRLYPNGLQNLSLLDVGSRTGAGAGLLQQLHHPDSFSRIKLTVTALDIEDKYAKYANRHFPDVEYLIRDIFDESFKRTFDVVVCSHTIEHVSDPQQFLVKLRKIARQWVIIACPFEEQPLIQGHINNINFNFFEDAGAHFTHVYRSETWHGSMAAIAAFTGQATLTDVE